VIPGIKSGSIEETHPAAHRPHSSWIIPSLFSFRGLNCVLGICRRNAIKASCPATQSSSLSRCDFSESNLRSFHVLGVSANLHNMHTRAVDQCSLNMEQRATTYTSFPCLFNSKSISGKQRNLSTMSSILLCKSLPLFHLPRKLYPSSLRFPTIPSLQQTSHNVQTWGQKW
jgi:hypothetical protein